MRKKGENIRLFSLREFIRWTLLYTNIRFYTNSKKSGLAVQFDNNSPSDSIRYWLQTKNGTHAMGGSGFNLRSLRVQASRRCAALFPEASERQVWRGARVGATELRDGRKRER